MKLEEFDIAVADSIEPVAKANFSAAWEKLGGDHEFDETFALSSVSTIEEAIKKMCECLGLTASERSDRVPEGRSQHSALLAGVFRGGHEVLAKVNLAVDPHDNSVNMNIIIRYSISSDHLRTCFRSDDDAVVEVVASAIA